MRKRGALRDAEINLNEVLETDPACAKAWFRRGQVRVGLDKWELARVDLARAAELDASVAADVRRELRALWAKTASLDERDRRRYKHVFSKLAVYGDKDIDPRKLEKLRREADRREAATSARARRRRARARAAAAAGRAARPRAACRCPRGPRGAARRRRADAATSVIALAVVGRSPALSAGATARRARRDREEDDIARQRRRDGTTADGRAA